MELAIANLRPALRDLALKLELPALWRWWMDELAPLMPTAPRAALRRRRLRPVLAFGADAAVLWDPRVDNGTLLLTEAAAIPLAGDAAAVAHAGRTAIAALPARALSGGVVAPKVIVALAPAQVLRKTIVLPAAVEENLIETLAYDLDRHTPFRPDQLYFDATVIGRDMAKKEIRVDWAAALKTVVDHARRQAESWGAAVIGVTPETLAPASAAVVSPSGWSKLNLLPHEDRPYATPWRRWQFWVPLALIAVMALVAVGLPLWQKREFVIELSQVTEQARLQAAAADALRQQLDQAAGDYNFALGKKFAYPSSVQLLDDVTRLLPDDTWLTQFEVKNVPKGKEPHREMLLRGETANAGKLISALEESKQFEQAAPRSPTTKIQPGPGEVFDLGSQIIPLPSPPMVALVTPVARPGAAGSESGPAATGERSTGASTAPGSISPASGGAKTGKSAGATPPAATPAAATPAAAAPATATPAPAAAAERAAAPADAADASTPDGSDPAPTAPVSVAPVPAGTPAETQAAQRMVGQGAAARAARAAQSKAAMDQGAGAPTGRQVTVPAAGAPATTPSAPAAGAVPAPRAPGGAQGSVSGTGTGAGKS